MCRIQGAHVAAPDGNPPPREEAPEQPRARGRLVEVQLIESAHQREIRRWHGARLIIDRPPADAERGGLARQGQRVRAVDHRLALSRPALPSARSKKSFSSASSPILAWSVFTSTGGSARLGAPRSTGTHSPSLSRRTDAPNRARSVTAARARVPHPCAL